MWVQQHNFFERKQNGEMTIPTSSSARGDATNTNAAPAPPRDVAIAIVKASQREHVISRLWPEFVKVKRGREKRERLQKQMRRRLATDG